MKRMAYMVREIYYTLQGEGANVGRAAVFCRFTGCNLWSGREEHRAKSACRFCDTKFVGTDGPGGGRFANPKALGAAIRAKWPGLPPKKPKALVVFTGGEPLLQLDENLLSEVHALGFEAAIETNGTMLPPEGLDWICVSPKGKTHLALERGSELKLVYPQEEPEAQPERFEHLAFDHFFLQPMDGPDREKNIGLAARYCLEHPRWRLSLQTHKLAGLR